MAFFVKRHLLPVLGEGPTSLATMPHPLYARSMTASAVPTELLGPVVAYFQPRRVILFGSAARGDAGADSDLDLFVILDDDAPPEKLTLAAGYEARRTYHRAADVIPCRASVFKRKSRIAGTLAHAAATDGIVVYER
jgi:predicted nucleotidyltransferase